MPTGNKTKQKVKVDPPIQISIWEILESDEFEKNLTEEMKLMTYTGEHYDELKRQVEEQYKKDIATLELAHRPAMKELLKAYSKPEEFTTKYVEVIAKKSRLSKDKRELISDFFAGIVKRSAIDIINNKDKKKCESQQQGTTQEQKGS